MKPEKVYVVTSGEYSDYGICAVFDNRKAAEEYCALGHGEMVEEYDLMESVNATAPVSVVYRFCVTNPRRNELDQWPCYLLEKDVEEDKAKVKKWSRQDRDILTNPYHIDRYVYLKENNPELALKIVRDRIAKAKAEKEGL